MQYFQITEHNSLPAIGQFAPFKVVLAIEDSVSRDRQIEVSNWLVEMGGKYVMICGDNSQGWEKTIRQANLDQVDLEDMKPEEFVMITPHGTEKLRNVFWHAKKIARHSHVKMNNILAIHIGERNRSVEYLSMFEKA